MSDSCKSQVKKVVSTQELSLHMHKIKISEK